MPVLVLAAPLGRFSSATHHGEAVAFAPSPLVQIGNSGVACGHGYYERDL